MKFRNSFLVFISFILLFSQPSVAQNFSCDKFFKSAKEKLLGRPLSPEGPPHAFEAGLIEARDLINVAENIRSAYSGKSRADRSVHVEALIPLAEKTLQYIENDLASLPFWQREDKNILLLQSLKEELATRIQAKQVTYHWLFVLSFRASILTDRSHEVSRIWTDYKDLRKETFWHSHEAASELLRKFTTAYEAFLRFETNGLIALPTFGDLGVYAINLMATKGIGPLGHISGKVTIDDQPMFSFSFWAHDASHMWSFQNVSPEFLAYAEKFLKLAQLLPKDKRMMVEFYFFYASHERSFLYEYPQASLQDLRTKYGDIPMLLFYSAKSPTFYGPILQYAGVKINNYEHVKVWLKDAFEEFLKIHTQANDF